MRHGGVPGVGLGISCREIPFAPANARLNAAARRRPGPLAITSFIIHSRVGRAARGFGTTWRAFFGRHFYGLPTFRPLIGCYSQSGAGKLTAWHSAERCSGFSSQLPQGFVNIEGSMSAGQIGLIGGSIVGLLASTQFVLHARSSRQFRAFHMCLERTHR